MLFRRDPDFADAPEETAQNPEMAVFVTISPQRVLLRFLDRKPVGLDLNHRLRANIGCETWQRARYFFKGLETGTYGHANARAGVLEAAQTTGAQNPQLVDSQAPRPLYTQAWFV